MFIKQQRNDYSNYFDLRERERNTVEEWDRGEEIFLIIKKKFILFLRVFSVVLVSAYIYISVILKVFNTLNMLI